MHIGDHLVTPRPFYQHHGIYVGSGKVIHYGGYRDGFSKDTVIETSLKKFTQGYECGVVKHENRKYSPRESVKRARSRLGEDFYNLLFNNCEQFVNWCIDGKHTSTQTNLIIDGITGAVGSSKCIKSIAAGLPESTVNTCIDLIANTFIENITANGGNKIRG